MQRAIFMFQVLLREAEEEGDQETLEYYQRITSAQKWIIFLSL